MPKGRSLPPEGWEAALLAYGGRLSRDPACCPCHLWLACPCGPGLPPGEVAAPGLRRSPRQPTDSHRCALPGLTTRGLLAGQPCGAQSVPPCHGRLPACSPAGGSQLRAGAVTPRRWLSALPGRLAFP